MTVDGEVNDDSCTIPWGDPKSTNSSWGMRTLEKIQNLERGKKYPVSWDITTAPFGTVESWTNFEGNAHIESNNAHYLYPVPGDIIYTPAQPVPPLDWSSPPTKSSTYTGNLYLPKARVTAYDPAQLNSGGKPLSSADDGKETVLALPFVISTPPDPNAKYVRVDLEVQPINMPVGVVTLALAGGAEAYMANGTQLMASDLTVDFQIASTSKLKDIKAGPVTIYVKQSAWTGMGSVRLEYDGPGVIVDDYASLLPVEIEEVISDQIAGNEANKLPTAFYGGHPNNPMLMATRSGSDARLAIKINSPTSLSGLIRIGVRETGKSTILNSAPAVAPPGKTRLAFSALSGMFLENRTKTYDIVAGYDADGDAKLDSVEASLVFQKTPKLNSPVTGGGVYSGPLWNLVDKLIVVTERDFLSARVVTEGFGTDPIVSSTYITAARFISAFATGANIIPGSNMPEFGALLDANTIPFDGLSHPLGGKWDSLNQTTTHRLVLPVGSDLSDDVLGSTGLRDMYGRILWNNRVAIAAAATTSWSVVTVNFTDEDIDFETSDRYEQVHVALGKCKFVGTLEISCKLKPGGGFDVGALNCYGATIDLYDFAHGAGKIEILGHVFADPKVAARTQAGYATLAAAPWPDAGRVFFTKVEIGTGWFDYIGSYP